VLHSTHAVIRLGLLQINPSVIFAQVGAYYQCPLWRKVPLTLLLRRSRLHHMMQLLQCCLTACNVIGNRLPQPARSSTAFEGLA
jgi:hypothetical protein